MSIKTKIEITNSGYYNPMVKLNWFSEWKSLRGYNDGRKITRVDIMDEGYAAWKDREMAEKTIEHFLNPKKMRKVIMIDEPKEASVNPVKFTCYLSRGKGFVETDTIPGKYEKVVYLGYSDYDGADMFAAYADSGIDIFKGHLNSGMY